MSGGIVMLNLRDYWHRSSPRDRGRAIFMVLCAAAMAALIIALAVTGHGG